MTNKKNFDIINIEQYPLKIKNKTRLKNDYYIHRRKHKREKFIDAYSEQVENTTNNEMELMALIAVIEKYGTEDDWGCPEVYSDSMYAINCLTNWAYTWELNNWYRANGKPIENLALVQKGYSLLKSNTHNVNINYCKGHNGIEGNELADKLATGEISAEEVLNKYGR